ncbi:chemotaxis signal transduction protein [Thermococcus kodakarensis KOD1]|uniref:Chemotaxis signal transduction protein n=1 Tax=Thermococcus kodakarensis (strain ATCC BAA-918 / JCM 12380 / KOD1) TaxID=69014 RepID=Q5JF99_THEKO|nr:chemotaxis protein CheW [Thermococcus kodakarensis]WCN28674.1 chemotaxis protein CheW [Thermococcus kodakarensis]WCN30972.1 chemotaxis protein CheW [Thermococcus kodakarensis]BAD84818.1 chemotaxis signal transduction protein [Thermococcus kodakarensis KOD1]
MSEIQVVAFRVGNEEFCLEISKVREIKEMMPITRVPNAPDYVEGVINLRGQITTVVNLKKKLGYYDDEDLSNKKIIIAEVKGEIVGIIVDAVSDVVTLTEDQIEPTPKTLASRMDTRFIKGIAKINNGERLLIMVDLDKLLGEEW